MVASATLLRDKIEQAWDLTGELSKVQTGSGATLMDEVVQFFDRKQVVGNEVPKSITIEKINDEGNENITRHPNFNEVTDIYDITVYYRVVDVQESNFSSALDLIENMAKEVTDILITQFDPATPIGIYFKSSSSWINEDMYLGNQPELRRKLRLQLTAITADNVQAYNGLSGVLIFDAAKSSGANKPGNNTIYFGVAGVKIREGYTQIPLLTKDVSNGVGVPFQTRGLFSGTFTAIMVASRGNVLGGNTLNEIENIYKVQTFANDNLKRQNATVVLLHQVNNSETVTSKVLEVNITNSGADYTSTPTVAITGGGGLGATAIATIEDGRVTGIILTDSGFGFTSVPTIAITGGGGTNATAIAVLTNETTKRFQTQTFMKIDNIFKDSMDDDLVKYTITGTLTKPSIFTEVTPQ